MRAVREAFERARTDAGEIDAAIAVVEAFLAANGDRPVAAAYKGSLHAMKAGASLLPWVKLKHADIASGLLDRAHERRFECAAPASADVDHPGLLEILLLRGIAYASFPPFLGCGGAARDSLEEAVGHPAFRSIPATYRALACAHLAVLSADEADRAQGLLREARDTDGAVAEAVWAAR